jgi:type II secretory pathway predicted ATPase ExeA
MYLDYFKLKELPFLASPDVRFLYLTNQVEESLQKCLYMITNKIGPLYVFGPYGAGKTSLATRLRQQLEQDPERYIVSFLIAPPPPSPSNNALLRMMMEEFDIKTDRSYNGNLKNIAAWLVEKNRAGKKPVIIIDEAHYLTPENLKLIHFLLNYETAREKLLQIVLFGQLPLADKIERFPALKSRMYPTALAALNRKDMEEMIAFRWYVAGGGKPLPFSAETFDEIFRVTVGLPREIVKVCDLSLLKTMTKGLLEVSVDDVDAAAKELRLSLEEEQTKGKHK